MQRDELGHWLRLTLTPGVGNAGARSLLAAFGLPEAVFQQCASALARLLSPALVQAMLAKPDTLDERLTRTWDWLQADRAQRTVWTLGDAAYPASLLQLEDPPLLLYAMGSGLGLAGRQLPAQTHCLAVVGSRNPTPQGAANAQRFASALVQSQLCIVSGLALGIDGAAHAGALEGAGSQRLATIAVVGTGLDRVYPKRHLALAHQIAQNGCLLSEYPLGTPALAANFPKRNRLIAGLSRGVLVVEAALQSGSLITARLGAEQGKDVFAIPGSIHSPQSRGCHALIKQGAKLVESAQDVLEEFGWPAMAADLPQETTDLIANNAHGDWAQDTFDAKTPAQSALLALLGFEALALQTLIDRSGMDAATVQAQLLPLELDGQVARLPGGLFQRVVRA